MPGESLGALDEGGVDEALGRDTGASSGAAADKSPVVLRTSEELLQDSNEDRNAVPLYVRSALGAQERDQLCIFHVRRTVDGLGFRLQCRDNKITIREVFRGKEAPVIKGGNLAPDMALLEADQVLQIDDVVLESLEQANNLIMALPLEQYAAVHTLRPGTIPGKVEAKLEEERLEKRNQALQKQQELEREQVVAEQEAKIMKKLEMRRVAKEDVVLGEFIKACELSFTVPDVELMSRVHDAFGAKLKAMGRSGHSAALPPCPVRAPAWHRRTTKLRTPIVKTARNIEAATTTIGTGNAATGSAEGSEDADGEKAWDDDSVIKLDFVTLHVLKSVHVSLLCQVLRRLRGSGVLQGVKVLLNFGYRELDRMGVHAIAQALGAFGRDLRVQCEGVNTGMEASLKDPCMFGPEFLRTVVPAFVRIEKLESVCLSESNLTDAGSQGFVDALRACTGLQTLDVSHNSFGAGFASALVTLFTDEDSLPRKTLRTVLMGWNELGTEGGSVLFGELLNAKDCVLEELDVSFNGLDDAVAASMRKLLEANTIKSLQKLNISQNRLTHAGGNDICAALQANLSMVEFAAGFNKLGLDATLHIVSKVRFSKTMQVLLLENTCGDYTDLSTKGARYAKEGKDMCETFCDDSVQYLWDLKEHMNALRTQQGEQDPIDVQIEYPFKQRDCESELMVYCKWLDLEKEEEAAPVVEIDPLELKTSIFKERMREADSRAFFDTAAVNAMAVKTDWTFLAPKLARFIKNPEDVAEVKTVVEEHYFALNNIFRHYAAQGDEHDCIGFNEFIDIVEICRIPDNASCPENAAQGAFIAANVEIEAETKAEKQAMDENPDNAMCLYEMIEALIRLALKKYFDKNSLKKAESPREAVIWTFQNHVLPGCEQFQQNNFRRDHVYNYDIVCVLDTYKLKIDRIWREYAGSSGATLLMKIEHWKEMCLCTGLSKLHVFESNKKGAERPVQVFPPSTLQYAFWAAQTLEKNKLVRNVRDRARNSSDTLTYTEFLESLVYLADTIRSPRITDNLGLPDDAYLSEKLVVVIEAMCGAEPPDIFKNANYPAMLNSLRDNHVPMKYPDRDDYLFEQEPPPAPS